MLNNKDIFYIVLNANVLQSEVSASNAIFIVFSTALLQSNANLTFMNLDNLYIYFKFQDEQRCHQSFDEENPAYSSGSESELPDI